MAQLDYSQYMASAFAGMKVNTQFDHVESFATSEDVAFGLGVRANSTNPGTVVDLVANAADVFRGIALHVHNESGLYIAKDTASILRRGGAWVEVNATVAIDAPAYIDVSDAKFTSVSTSNLATGGFFRSARVFDGTAGVINIAVVEINLP